jgi:NADH-quinone oxidoreductase subunit N
MAFFLLSLIGIPFTGGFFGKFYVFTAAVHSGMIWLAIIGLLNSGIAVFYYLRVLTATYTKPMDASPVLKVPRASAPLLVAIFLTVAATLILGIFPTKVLSMAHNAAETFPILSAQQTPVPATGAAVMAAIPGKIR